MDASSLSLEMLGWSAERESEFAKWRAEKLEPGRVVIEDKQNYTLFTRLGVLEGRASGQLLQAARSQAELPKVGDWVAVEPRPDHKKALIRYVLPRTTKLARKVLGRPSEEQVLATNVDVAFLVQSFDQGLNQRVLERMLLSVREAGIKPVVVLNKCDLSRTVEEVLAQAQKSAGDAPVLAVSARTGKNARHLLDHIKPGQTGVLLGASGVGKSSLINRLYGEEVATVTPVRDSDAKGRHTTTWRELIVLPQGALIIDTPGLRQFQLWVAGEGLQETFPEIFELAAGCKFRDCRHEAETGCAVKAALEAGRLSVERYQNFLKVRREIEALEQARLKRQWKPAGRPKRERILEDSDE